MKPDPNSHTAAPLAELLAIEHRIEDAVDHAVHRAERSIALRFGLGAVRWLRRALKVIATAVLVTGFAFGLTVLVLRYWLLPRVDDYRPWLQQELSRLLGSDVRIGHIEAGWQGLRPQLAVSDLRLLDANGRDVLILPQVDAVLSWTSVAAAGLRLQDLIVQGPALEVRRNADGTFVIAGFALASGPAGDGALVKNVLAQPHVSIRGARLRYVDVTADGEHSVEFSDVAFEYRRGVLGNRFALRAAPPPALGGTLDVRGEFSTPWGEAQADMARWRGRLFVQSEALDLVQLARLSRALPAPAQLERARGAVRGWLDFDALRISRLTVDLALADVQARLGEQVEAIALDRLAGRLTMRAWGESAAGAEGGEEWQLTDLALSGPDLKLPPTQLSLRLTRPQPQQAARGRLEADQLSLDTITTLGTHLPLPPPLRQLLARYGLRGQLTSLRYAWEGELQAPQRYAMRTEFGALSAVAEDAAPRQTPGGRPRPGRPGFTNLSGKIEFDESGGEVRIDASDVTLDLRGVLPQPIAWRNFAARANFRLAPTFELGIDEFSASNADVELTAAGRYQRGGKGPGLIDASGRINRADAAQIHNYLPLITGARTRAWLRAALVGGEAHDGTFELKGDLADFPFSRAGSGQFRVATRVRNGTLDYAPQENDDSASWPAISGIDGELRFERATMAIDAQRGSVYGVKLADVKVRIDDLNADDPRLKIDGQGAGALADMVRYVNNSPLEARLDGFLRPARVSGDARLRLQLEIPLHQVRATRVRGGIDFGGNDVALGAGIPALRSVTGRLEFAERTLQLAGITANVLDGSARIDGATRPDGAIQINARGNTAIGAVRTLVEAPLLHRLLERMSGTAPYSARILVHRGRPQIEVESTLAGVRSDLPAPLAKEADDALPLRLTIEAAGDERNLIRVTAGDRLALQLERSRERTDGSAARLLRGTLAVGSAVVSAPLADSGLRVLIDTPRLDIDRWRPLVTEAKPASLAGGNETGFGPDSISIRAAELVVAGRSLADVVLDGRREAGGTWRANLASNNAAGAVIWRPAAGGDEGRISARLTRLAIARDQRDEVTQLLEAGVDTFPALDLRVDEFELAGRKLGRLELLAENAGAGRSAAWNLQSLTVTNPDGDMTATGQWQRRGGAERRSMALDLKLKFSDGGRLLTRLGIAEALRGGEGTLEGKLHWQGSPLAIDYSSLSGKLQLATKNGRFLKASAGAGRLLGVLSLQALPRRLTLDFTDVFAEGFAFDEISANAELTAGRLTTRDFKMRGVSATVLIEGSVDLPAETQDLHVLVLPELDAGSASLAYALFANPAIGLGAFIAQMLLRDPLSRMLSYEYDVTGSWSDPQVGKHTRAASAPTENIPGR